MVGNQKRSVFLVVHSDYDIYSIYGVYLSEDDAEADLRLRGFRIYSSGTNKGLWSKRDFLFGLQVDEYPFGWQEEEGGN